MIRDFGESSAAALDERRRLADLHKSTAVTDTPLQGGLGTVQQVNQKHFVTQLVVKAATDEALQVLRAVKFFKQATARLTARATCQGIRISGFLITTKLCSFTLSPPKEVLNWPMP